jgi:hypothetical protein
MVLNRAGVDTEIIISNFSLVLGAFLLAFSLALRLGSKEIIGYSILEKSTRSAIVPS